MKVLRNVVIVLLIGIVLLFSTTSQAVKVEVTRENLEQAFKDFVNSENNEEDMNIDVLSDIIKIYSEDQEIEIKYDLTDKPTFTREILVKNGMSYEEFEEEYDKLMYPMIGYMAVGNIQGANFEDVGMYILMNIFGTALSEGMNSDGYIVYDDINGNMIPQIKENQKLIKQSEFDKYVMEYVNDGFKENVSINDSEGINSYTWTMKQEDVTETSCKLVSTLSVDLDADFSKIEELVDELEESFNTTANNITIDGNTNSEESDEKNTATNLNSIPKAGVEFGVKNILQIVIFVSILSVVIILITSKKEKN